MSVLKTIDNTLITLGGGDKLVLAECPPNEQRQFSLSTIFNVNQALISGGAMAFTLYSLNKNLHIFIIFSLSFFWAFICFMINVGLVGSISKAKKEQKRNVFSLIIRLAITIVISLLTSQVIELYIFEPYFPLARRKQQVLAAQDLESMGDSKGRDLKVIKERLESVDREIEVWHSERNSIFGTDTILIDLTQQRESLNSRLVSLSAQYRELNRISGERISSAQRSIAAISIEQSSLSREDDQRLRDLNNQIAAWNGIITQENRQINQRNTELSALDQSIAAQQRVIDNRRELLDTDNRERTQVFSSKREMVAAAYLQAEADLATFVSDNERASSNTFLHDSLINRMITLQFILGWKDDVDATYEERETAVKIMQIRLLIMALFLIIDLAPFLIILLSKRGKYEALKESELESSEAIIAIQKKHRILQAEFEIQAQHKIIKDKIESQNITKEIELLTQQSKDVYDIMCITREEAMSSIYRIDNEFDLGDDTENIIKELLQKTQQDAKLKLYASRDHNPINFNGGTTYQPSSIHY